MTESHDRDTVLKRIRSGELDVEDGMRLLEGGVGRRSKNGGSDTVAPVEREPVRRPGLGEHLRHVVAGEAEIPVDRVKPHSSLEDFGFDSVMALNVVRALEADFGKLPSTLLFEYRTLADLAEHLSTRYPGAARRLLAREAPVVEGRVSSADRVPAPGPRQDKPAPDTDRASDAIAIVGISGRFPLADDLDQFWDNLAAGRDCITEIPADRWDHREYFDPEPGKAGKSYTKWGGFLRDVAAFDAEFFHISPREAERMDPQERLFLEEVWHALEDGGITRSQYADRETGVYVGVMYSQYQLFQAEEALVGNPLYLGSSYASIANRVSYAFDLTGPSMAVDTMCSSSLTAIHLACEALWRGDIDMAIAGGVNLSLHPAKFHDLSQGRFASTDGRCRSFGAGGDGYVPGEGVGAAVLKPLSAAEADGDRIHAVIKGSTLGHGGKTNGYSVPDPQAQSRVISTALRRAGISPDQVSYVEAHGTGTSLGDPIEIAGVEQTLGASNARADRCAIGSVKSNIGHLESAAGIAGLAKIVLQLRHKRLAPSLHAEELNPHIDFEDTCLTVPRDGRHWWPAAGTDRRIAGLSSFGAGGANAHLVIEEYPLDGPVKGAGADGRQLIVLSARTEKALRAQAQELAEAAAHGDRDASWLAAAAHTLRCGREALEERLAVLVEGVGELEEALTEFARTGRAPGVLRGTVDLAEPGPQVSADSAGLEHIAQLWIEGAGVDWTAAGPRLPKISLPHYPFARERHWPDLTARKHGAAVAARLPPLLHADLSLPGRQRFLTVLDASHPLVRDHVIAGEPTLPGAVLIELARAAGVHSGLGEAISVRNTVFESPVAVGDTGCELSIELTPAGDGADYVVFGGRDGQDRPVYARGRLDRTDREPVERIDVPGLERADERMEGDLCYQALRERGLSYGPELQVLQEITVGDGYALGRLHRPSGPDEYGLHPSLLDGAFQVLVAFHRDDARTRVPFLVERVEALGDLPDECWVYAVPRVHGPESDVSAAQVFDLAMTDAEGTVVARVRGLTVRPVLDSDPETVLLGGSWRQAPLHTAADELRGTVLVLDDDAELAQGLAAGLSGSVVRARPGREFRQIDAALYEFNPRDPDDHRKLIDEAGTAAPLAAIVHAWSRGPAADGEAVSADLIDQGFHSMLALATALSAGATTPGLRVLYMYRADGTVPAFSAVAALQRTLQAEKHEISCTAVQLVPSGAESASASHVAAELKRTGAETALVRYDHDGVRWEHGLSTADDHSGTAGGTFRKRGVYLLTGGLGGLGRQLARHLAQNWQARLALSGRSELSDDGAAFLEELRSDGGDAIYLPCDCSSEEGARELVSAAEARYGRLDGVIHLAGTLRDRLLAHKQREDAEAVLLPKVWGAYALDRATREIPLDFFALFSSASSVMGIAGQGDYAFANAFLNHFADWREERRVAGQRSGRTVSIAWPLWEAGGMDVDDAAKEYIERNLGWLPLPVDAGMRLFTSALQRGSAQQAAFYGHRTRILQSLDGVARSGEEHVSTLQQPEIASEQVPPIAVAALRDHVARIVAAELKAAGGRLDTSRRFEQLGLESVMAMNITRQLEKIFGELPKTLFFEYQNVDQLCEYFVTTRPGAVNTRFGASSAQGQPERTRLQVQARAVAAPEPRHVSQPSADEPIAIVGLSGRYPMAGSVDELWENLKQGRDAITEVPSTRWDHDRFFDPESGLPGMSYSRWGGFLDGVDLFDPRFFGISPREARQMDPQERLFLETAWHTFEDAGYARGSLPGRVGVFAGVMYTQYQLYGADPAMQASGFVPGSLSSSVANRVSYALDLHGPSMAVDTMCSSSLTALHLACAAIRLGDCDAALAGGVNTILHPNRYLQLSQGKFASSDGRCRSFGAGGDGYVPGEGVGAVLLKRLSQAVADGDHIYGVVRGTAVNHGGRTNGFTVPAPAAQSDVIGLALDRAGVAASEIGYVEAHGTGTSLGDPIEIEALSRVFGSARADGARCPVGSVKSNIGHLESAAGIAALTKVLLQMRHRELVPSLHSDELNPNIRFADGPFRVQRAGEPWSPLTKRDGELPLLATVSSFGAGGSNAHAVIEEYVPDAAAASSDSGPELIMLSAPTADQIREVAGSLADRIAPSRAVAGTSSSSADLITAASEILGVPPEQLDAEEELANLGFDTVTLGRLADRLAERWGVHLAAQELLDLGTLHCIAEKLPAARPDADDETGTSPDGLRLRDIAFTLAAGREPQDERVAFVARDMADLGAKLRDFASDAAVDGLVSGRAAKSGANGGLAGLLTGSHAADFLDALRREGDLPRLASMWVSGVDLAGSGLPTDKGARRVPLPGTPFRRERYWVPEEAAPKAPEAVLHNGVAEATPALAEETVLQPLGHDVTPSSSELPGSGAVTPRTASHDEVRDTITEVMAAVLEIPAAEFDLDAAHVEFGVDSVLAVEIVEQINRALGVGLKPTDFFSYSTIRKLTEHVFVQDPVLSGPASTATETEQRSGDRKVSVPRQPVVAEYTAPAAVGSAFPAEARPTDIAVVGMSGRFPGARNLDELWANLVAGRDLVGEIPPERWEVARHWHPDTQEPNKTYSKWGSVLEDIDQFDPAFFGLSPREARLMDPQQRLFLMEAWRALEDAGYSDRSLDGRDCHVMVGTGMGDYHHLLKANGVPLEGYTFMGTHPAVLASRLSYHLNLTGPSLAVDTSCSSSLMAVHQACEAIRSGQTELAIAGGVAALVTPELHVLASKAGMLSPTGKCRPFDDQADGFVPGEGVGVVVLKSLAKALADGDHVHGVIAATGANQDGRSNGLTAPSAPAQSALQTSTYQRFRVDPAQISYVECHGTGTKLGDPIEIEALHKTFGEGLGKASCAVGSIKSNLGHTLTAAGVASLLKTLLCLRHGQLVPSLHAATPNRYIPFDDSPFRVTTEAQQWRTPAGVPRMAAINSFGFSGTNVHVVVREAPPAAPREPEAAGHRKLCPVSAKTASALDERLRELSSWLAGEGARHEWRDIVRTLAVGRSHFEVRAVFEASSPEELREQIDDWRRGNQRRVEGRPGGLADRYLAGESIDWSTVDGDGQGTCIPMPTYPFARESYWVPGVDVSRFPGARTSHPQPEAVEADGEKVFTYQLSPDQPLVADHVVDEKPLLPAAGHLSFVHQALQEVLGTTTVTLRRVVWLRPVFVTEKRTIQVAVQDLDGERFSFQVRSTGPDGAVIQHSRGEGHVGAGSDAPAVLDEIRERCTGSVSRRDHYERFDRIGVLYGAEFTRVQSIRIDGATEALATLERGTDDSVVPAGMLDGAIQSVAALQPETEGQRPHVPFAMEEIRVVRPVPRTGFAHIRQSKPGECTVSIIDEAGRPCVVIDGMAYRELKEPVRTELYQPYWRRQAPQPRPDTSSPSRVLLVVPPDEPGLAPLLAERHRDAEVATVRLDDSAAAAAAALASGPLPDRIYFLGGLDQAPGADAVTPPSEVVERAQEYGVRSLFRLVRQLAQRCAGEHRLALTSVTGNALAVSEDERSRPLAAGLFGLTRSLAKEHLEWRVGCVDISLAELSGPEAGSVADAVVADPGHESGDEVALRSGERWQRALRALPVTAPQHSPFRKGGTYLILGGAGGIGGELAVHLAARARATVILLGRRPLDERIEERLRAVSAAGGRAEYLQVDATDEAAMAAMVTQVKSRFGPVNGVFHSALVLRDGRLENMSEETFDAVLEPKVCGTAVLARVLHDEAPDFIAFFSSAQSFSGNPGQANYAAACTFKDAFAAALSASGVPVHIINWGYWGGVGVVAKAGYRRRMQAIGVHSIGVDEGMAALESVIAGGVQQVMPLKAEQRVLAKFGIVPGEVAPVRKTGEEPWSPIPDLPQAPDGERLRRAHAALDSLGAAMVVRSMHQLGVFTAEGETRSAERLAGDIGVVPAHASLWRTLLRILIDTGYLRAQGDDLVATTATQEIPRRDFAADQAELVHSYPEVSAHAELLSACLREYPALLRGEVESTEVMFPNSSMSRVEGVYRGDPLADRLNDLVARAVCAHLDECPPDRPFRVLEVGAGTGGTSGNVLAALSQKNRKVEYVYTDVSIGFLRHGRKHFGTDHPYVEFRRLDIERPVEEQGFTGDGFDVVVAANVLHATNDVRRVLDHVASLLADGGRLVLSETTAFSVFATLTFGLLEGWWRREDERLRIEGSPLVDVPTWCSLFADAGFGRSAAFPPVRTDEGEIGQNVLVAERGTTVRSKALPQAPSAPAVLSSAAAESSNVAPQPTTTTVHELLASSIAETLGREDADIDPHRAFTDYGVDSIILVELVDTLNARLGIDLKTTALFDYPTLAELTEFVLTEHREQLPAVGARLPEPTSVEPAVDGDSALDLDLLERVAAGELTVDQAYARLEQE